jgi:hypothetical protein
MIVRKAALSVTFPNHFLHNVRRGTMGMGAFFSLLDGLGSGQYFAALLVAADG